MLNLKNKTAGFLCQLGLSANSLTVAGLVLAFVCSFLIYRGSLSWAGVVLMLSGSMDLLDGAVARVSGKESVFGGILDSSLDRYGEGAVLGALVFYFLQNQKNLIAAFAMSALIGSFLISYVRARAECEIANCRVGFWERGERVSYLSLGLMCGNPAVVAVVLGVGTHWTAIRRLTFASSGASAIIQKKASRNTALYFVQCFLILLSLFLKKT